MGCFSPNTSTALSSFVTAPPPKSMEADKERPLYEDEDNARAEAAPPRRRAAFKAAEAGALLLLLLLLLRRRKEAEDRRRSMRTREPRRKALLGRRDTLMRLFGLAKKSRGLFVWLCVEGKQRMRL